MKDEKIAKTVVLLSATMGKLSITLNEGKRGFHIGFGHRAMEGTVLGTKTVRGGSQTFATFAEAEKAHLAMIKDAIDKGWTIRESKAKITSIPVATVPEAPKVTENPTLVKKSVKA